MVQKEMNDFARDLIDSITEQQTQEFKERKSILSFDEYLRLVVENPRAHIRDASRYMVDVIDHFGTQERQLSTGTLTRHSHYDAEFDEGNGRVIGQERVQEKLVGLLRNFARAGRADRLVLLHGPNGSAKTSLIQGLTKAAEHYSHTPQGALYGFGWVFPISTVKRGSLGFGGSSAQTQGSFAHLEGHNIESRVPCELRDHPLFLLSKKHRRALFENFVEQKVFASLEEIPHVLIHGDLSEKNRKVFDAMLSHYKGDVREVLRHIQIERFYFSRRYRNGIVAVEPQMSVDAHVQQITADRSLQALPPALQHLALFQAGGALAGANRGVLEFNDLLKRPLETWKYLLVVTEQAQASLDPISVFLDVVMLASSNDIHLEAFKQHPDWASFKGRFEMVTVPYLLRVQDEQAIYEDQIPKRLAGMHIAPFALELAARFAVLTRLERPNPDRYDERARPLVKDLTPEEKLELYNDGTVPERLSQKERKELRHIAKELYAEHDKRIEYEGSEGASVREVRAVIMKAAQDERFDHLSPEAVLDQLDELVRETSSYPFLRRDSQEGYRDAKRAAQSVRRYYTAALDDVVRSAIGLVDDVSHMQLFSRYLKHVSAWTKKVKLDDPVTGIHGDADEELMKEIESVLLASDEKRDEFRRSLITQIGAFKLEHPDDDVDYELLFGSYTHRLKEDFYEKRRSVVEKVQENFLKTLEGEDKNLDARDKEHVSAMRENLFAKGYNESSATKAVAYLLSQTRSK